MPGPPFFMQGRGSFSGGPARRRRACRTSHLSTHRDCRRGRRPGWASLECRGLGGLQGCAGLQKRRGEVRATGSRALSTEGGKRAVLVSFRAFIRATGHDAWEAVGPDAGARVCLPLVGTSFHELAVERAQAVPDDQEVQRGRELSGDEQRGQRPGGPGSRSGIGGSFTDRHHGSDESYGTSSWEGAAVATLSRSHRHSRRGRLPTRLSRCRVPT